MNQHHLGTYDPVAAAAAAGYQQPHYQQQQQQQLQPLHAQGEVRQHQQPVVTSPTLRDVLNGRGQGVQRHPGNVKYRTLVFVNKGLYAKCPRSDKMKISKGIVAAVCALSGRFLELDERSGIYRDIGDKKATEKTSQALREGQTKIRKQMYNDEKKIGGAHTYDMSLLSSVGPTATSPMSNLTSGREISAEGYFGYSVQVLESLYHEDEGAILHFSHPASVRPHPARIVASAVPSSSALAAAPTDPVAFGPSADANAAMIARALEQFPGSAPPPLPTPTMPSMLLPPPQQPMAAANAQARASELHPFMGRLTNDSLGRPSLSRITSTSMASMFSFTQLLELARNETQRPTAEDRGSIQSVLSAEIRDLIRLSEPQLVQVESMNIDDDMAYEDKEVNVLFDAQTMKDRVSELRFTDTSRDLGVKDRVSELRFTDTSRDHGGEPRREPDPRLTDSTEFTNYSRTSLMDASVMTIPTEDMSVQTGLDKRKRGSGVNDDRETADLLLRLSTENHWNRS